MQFRSLDWFAGHGIGAHIPWTTNMAGVRVSEYGRELKCCNSLVILIKAIIPFALVGYKMVTANSAKSRSWNNCSTLPNY